MQAISPQPCSGKGYSAAQAIMRWSRSSRRNCLISVSNNSRERFNKEVRFNWGYHDAASDHENGRRPMANGVVFEGTLEEWAAHRGGGAYIEGYLAGYKASTEGVYNMDSKSAFAESGLSA